MASDSLSSLRTQLLARGYKIIPNKFKVPQLTAWNSPGYEAQDIASPTIGLRVQDGLCIVDADIDHPIIADWFAEACLIAPDLDKAPTRFGGGEHKMALFCRTADSFGRVASKKYNGNCVEIFGGKPLRNGNCSRQFGIYGRYDKTRDYEWAEDVPDLVKVKPADLPLITKAQALAICGAFERLAEAQGWVADAAAEKEELEPGVSPGRDDAEIAALLAKASKRGHWHNSMLSAVASMIGHGWTDARILAACAPYADGQEGDEDVAGLIRSGRAKWNSPDPDKAFAGVKAAVAAAIEIKGEPNFDSPPTGATREDYYAFLPTHQYIYKHTGRLYPLVSINATLPRVTVGTKPKKQTKKQLEAKEEPEMTAQKIPAGIWLDRNRPVMEMSWAPGEPQLIEGQLACEGGWIDRPGVSSYNLYRPPLAVEGNPANAWRWVDLIEAIYPDHFEHIIAFCAHRVQRPQEKINHALVLTGSPGIGKDTLLEPLKHGVGSWNFREISPSDVTGKYNDFMKSVVLRVSETRDLGDLNRYAFYEATKTMTAAPPDMTRVNVKHIPQFYVPNVTAVIFTTNYPTDGLYLPPDDRRHYVCGTEMVRDETWDRYCVEMWKWYAAGGLGDVIAYLRAYDLSGFDAKAPPPKTAAFWRMVDAGRPSEEGEIRDVIARMGDPGAFTIPLLAANAEHDLREWLGDRKNNRNVSRRIDDCGYVPVRNPDNRGDGRWRVGGRNQIIYGRKDMPIAARFKEVEMLRKNDGRLILGEKSEKGS